MSLRKISRLRSRPGRERQGAASGTAPTCPDGTQTAPTGWLAERSESSRVASHGCHVAPDEFPGRHTRSLNRGLGNLKGILGKRLRSGSTSGYECYAKSLRGPRGGHNSGRVASGEQLIELPPSQRPLRCQLDRPSIVRLGPVEVAELLVGHTAIDAHDMGD